MEQKNILTIPTSIIVAGIIIGGAVLLKDGPPTSEKTVAREKTASQRETAPAVAAELAIPWGDLGAKLVSVGVIDRTKLDTLYQARGGLSEAERALLEELPPLIRRGGSSPSPRLSSGEAGRAGEQGTVVMTERNASFILNLLWALGLGQKSEVLSKGEMVNPRYGGAGRFASTGGWTLAKDGPMEHYGRHLFFQLTPEQEKLVSRVASNVYRPCCDNATHFPDCNHGMAMLGLLELLASNGASEEELYSAALTANRLWFPDQYAIIGEYEAFMRGKGEALTSKDLVGSRVASASGFARLSTARATWGTVPTQRREQGGGGCSV